MSQTTLSIMTMSTMGLNVTLSITLFRIMGIIATST
jgi:hypothetical protein